MMSLNKSTFFGLVLVVLSLPAILGQDTTPPTISCPADITENAGVSVDFATVTFTTTATDDIDSNPSVACTPQQSGIAFNQTVSAGTVVINCTATDNSTNEADCSFTVTVLDNTAPVLTCPDLVFNKTNITYDVTVVDNSGTAQVVCSQPRNQFFTLTAQQSPLPVNCTATDPDNALTSTCDFTITVNEDNTAPTLTCVDLTFPANNGSDANITFDVTVVDNFGTSTVVCSQPRNQFFVRTIQQGPLKVNCTATDPDNDLTSTCEFNITVVDNTAPVLTCPNLVFNTSAGLATANITFDVNVVDNSGVATAICSQATNTPFTRSVQDGPLSVNCTATDPDNGLTDTCDFTITVVDNQAPVLSCPNLSFNASSSGPTANISFDVTTGDNSGTSNTVCSQPINVFFTRSVADGPLAVNCTATDPDNGLTDTCAFTISVEDVTPPTISCPADQAGVMDTGISELVRTRGIRLFN